MVVVVRETGGGGGVAVGGGSAWLLFDQKHLSRPPEKISWLNQCTKTVGRMQIQSPPYGRGPLTRPSGG